MGALCLVAGAGCQPFFPPIVDLSPPTAPTKLVPPTTVATIPEEVGLVSESPTSSGPDLSALLACVRSLEQGAAGYATNTGNGYFGAYQFSASTGAWAVAGAGYDGSVEDKPDFSGLTADLWPPSVQDEAAAWVLSTPQGIGHWPLPAERCAA
ncbi:MAG TPA: hypothetical protein VF244_10980 [Acidimicrobiales bacterium]